MELETRLSEELLQRATDWLETAFGEFSLRHWGTDPAVIKILKFGRTDRFMPDIAAALKAHGELIASHIPRIQAAMEST